MLLLMFGGIVFPKAEVTAHKCTLATGIDLLEDLKCGFQQLLSLTLVGNCCLELLVLFLAILTCPLQLHLHLGDLGLEWKL